MISLIILPLPTGILAQESWNDQEAVIPQKLMMKAFLLQELGLLSPQSLGFQQWETLIPNGSLGVMVRKTTATSVSCIHLLYLWGHGTIYCSYILSMYCTLKEDSPPLFFFNGVVFKRSSLLLQKSIIKPYQVISFPENGMWSISHGCVFTPTPLLHSSVLFDLL